MQNLHIYAGINVHIPKYIDIPTNIGSSNVVALGTPAMVCSTVTAMVITKMINI